MLKKEVLSATDVKGLMQHFNNALAAGHITMAISKKVLDTRPRVFMSLVNSLLHKNEKFSDTVISTEVSVLETFNTNIHVVKAAGGRAADSSNVQVMKDLPRRAASLRAALFKAEESQDQGRIEDLCKMSLPKLLSASEAWSVTALKNQVEDIRNKVSDGFHAGIDALLDGMVRFEKSTEALIRKFGTMECNHLIDAARILDTTKTTGLVFTASRNFDRVDAEACHFDECIAETRVEKCSEC